jgi:hypothetical protein
MSGILHEDLHMGYCCQQHETATKVQFSSAVISGCSASLGDIKIM